MRERDVAIVIGIVALVVLVFGLMGGGMMGAGMMGWGMMGRRGFGWSPWWGVLMMFVWMLAIVGVVLVIAWLVRQGTRASGGQGEAADRALEILRERYARGEISREQFDEMRRNLEQSG